MLRLRIALALALVVAPATLHAQPAPKAPASPPGAPTAAPGPPAPAAAPPPAPLVESLTGDAKADYESGKLLFADGDHAGARLKFLHAHELSGDARLLWNVAACDKHLRRYARVEHYVERYVKEGGDRLSEADKAEAAALLDTVRAFISSVVLRGGEAGATVLVDDEPMGVLPLASPLRVELGRRRIVVKKEGFHDFERVEVFDGRNEVQLDVVQKAIVHQAKLVIDAPPGATITVDGLPAGTGHYEGVLPSGPHKLSVSAPGQRTHEADLVLRDDEVRSVAVTLQPLTVEDGPLFWPWILAGSVVAAGGLAVGGYFLFRPELEPVGGTITSVDLRASAAWSF